MSQHSLQGHSNVVPFHLGERNVLVAVRHNAELYGRNEWGWQALGNCPKNTLAFFDYESIHVALFHLIENSVKYVKPNTDINIDISTIGSFVEITFKMVSVAISKDEVGKIFQEGFSGKIPVKINKAGNGIGLYRARSIL